MKASGSDEGGYHVCDNEPFYDYESSLEMPAANQQKPGDTMSLSKINLNLSATQNLPVDISGFSRDISYIEQIEPEESFNQKNAEIDKAF